MSRASRWGSSIRTTREMAEVVRASGLAERLLRHRPRDLHEFLTALQGADPATLPGNPEFRRDALSHLGHRWSLTVQALARPETLPQVVEHRSRVRVHPVAPWVTAATAAGGSAAVVAGSAPGWLEGLGVAAVAGSTALASMVAWRPRTGRRDKRFAVTGTAALTARADSLLARGCPAADRTEQAQLDRQVAVLHGAARTAEAVERVADEGGLLEGGNLRPAPGTPAQSRLADDVVLSRARVVRCLLDLQESVRLVDARHRMLEDEEYARIVDRLHPGATPGSP